MCGIGGIIVRKAARVKPSLVERMADAMLQALQSRGTDATGFAAVTDEGLVRVQRAAVSASRFVPLRRSFPAGTRIVLLHTRYATQGEPDWPENNHPVRSGDTWAIHNGHVSNDRDVFATLGVERLGEVDSEAIPALVNGVGGFDHLAQAFEQLRGGIACAVISPRQHPGEVALVRANYSPLVVLETASLVMWASTREAIERAWRLAYGAPPKKGWSYPLEGTILRYSLHAEGEAWRTVSRFNPPQPAQTSSSWSGGRNWFWDDEDAAGGWVTRPTPKPTATVTKSKPLAQLSTPSLSPVAMPSVRQQVEQLDAMRTCDLCGDHFPEEDLQPIRLVGIESSLELSCVNCTAWAQSEGWELGGSE